MADPAQVDFATAFAAIRTGDKIMRRGVWVANRFWKWFAGSETSDPMMVEVTPNKQMGSMTVLVNDMVAADCIVDDLPAESAPV